MTETQIPLEEAIERTSSEELAYVLLEEARLRCKLLLEDERVTGDDAVRASLHALYGDLGIAGYYGCARLEPERRRELLALARARSRRHDDAHGGSVHQLSDVTAAATRAVERALTITGLLEDIHLAHVHAMLACETLDALFASQPR